MSPDLSDVIAINNVSAQAVSVRAVTIRNDAGTQIATESMHLVPDSDLAFTVIDKYG